MWNLSYVACYSTGLGFGILFFFLFVSLGAGDQSQGLAYAKQLLYH
jgi:hypothetical protein